MKKLLAVFIVFYVVFMGTVLVYGFIKKQQLESRVESTDSQNQNQSQPADSTTNSATTPAPSVPAPKTISVAEVAMHNKAANCWIIISGKAYNVTNFLDQHPGGADVIIPFCGKEATNAFNSQGGRGRHSSSAKALLNDYLIGTVQ
jgi:cytochrome b involved in lipid metabolism